MFRLWLRLLLLLYCKYFIFTGPKYEHKYKYKYKYDYDYQCGGPGSLQSVLFPWIRIRIKKWLDPESGSNDTDPDPTETIENIK